MTPGIKSASSADHATLLQLMRDYYAFESLPFDAARASSRLQLLLSNPSLGFALLAEIGRNPVGYAVAVYGFGLEHGRNAIIDEIFVTEAARGHGLGTDLVHHIEKIARHQGIESLHADVEHANTDARSFWTTLGFRQYDRSPMIRLL